MPRQQVQAPIRTGMAYLPVTVGVGIGAGTAPQLVHRIGTRPVIVTGASFAAVGVFLLSRIPVEGSYVSDLLPGMVVMSLGLGLIFVSITAAANAGVPADKAGLAAALLTASQNVGGALGLAVFSAVATARTNHLLASHTAAPAALTSGFKRALLAGAIALVIAALVGLRTRNVRSEGEAQPAPVAVDAVDTLDAADAVDAPAASVTLIADGR